MDSVEEQRQILERDAREMIDLAGILITKAHELMFVSQIANISPAVVESYAGHRSGTPERCPYDRITVPADLEALLRREVPPVRRASPLSAESIARAAERTTAYIDYRRHTNSGS